MSNIVPFSFEAHEVRVLVLDGEPWFVAADIARVLAHSNNRAMLQMLDEDEKGVSSVYTPGGNQEMAIISESGLYHAIFKSRKPQAKKFRKWVTSEVLPSIRKTGGYGSQIAQQPIPTRPTIQEIAETTQVILLVAGFQAHLIGGVTGNGIAKYYPERKELVEEVKKFLPLPVEDELLTVTNLARKYVETTGKQLSKNNTDHGNAIALNALLVERGLQTKNPNPKAKKDGQPAYLPTELGKQYGELVLQEATGNNKTVQQLRWYPSVFEVLG